MSIGSPPPEETEKLKRLSSQTYPAKAIRQSRSNQPPKQRWKLYGEERSSFNNNWSKPWSKSSKMSRNIKTLPNEFPGHLGPSKQFKHWRPQLPSSIEPSLTQNMTYPSTPLETNAGDVHQLNIQSPSRIYSSTMFKNTMVKTKSWGKGCQSGRTKHTPHSTNLQGIQNAL